MGAILQVGNIALKPELFAFFQNVNREQYFMTGNHEFYNDMTLLVSQGAGTFGPRMRLGASNELQFIRLIPAY